MRRVVYILLSIALFSCDKEIPFDYDLEENALVVNSYFSPDAPITLNLSRTTTLLGDPKLNSDFNSLRYSVFEDGNHLFTYFGSGSNGLVNTGIFPKAGRTYSAFIKVDELDEVECVDEVPLGDFQFTIDTTQSTDGSDIQLNIDLTDSMGNHFYLIRVKSFSRKYENGDSMMVSEIKPFTYEDRFFVSGISNVGSEVDFAICKDELFQNSSIGIELNTARADFSNSDLKPIGVEVEVRSISKVYYNYLESVLQNSHVYGSPLSFPGNVTSNVKDGFGVFAGYSAKTQTIYW